MKTKLLALVATLGMVASASAIKVNDNLSINGFIDGSYSSTESNVAANESQSLGLDEVEVNFNVNVGSVTGLVAIDSSVDANNDGETSGVQEGLNIEQAHITYSINDALSVTFGRYGSSLGFEREDPAGLYTFSRAYSGSFNLGDVDSASVEGITLSYAAENFSLAASVEEAAGAELETDDLNLEVAFTYTGIAGVNIGGGYFFDNNDNDDTNGGSETDILNVHVSRQFGKLLLAGEYSELSTSGHADADNNVDLDGYLLLADYDVSDKLGFAVRFSNNEQVGDSDYEKFTIAPNYALTDSLGAIVEYSDIDAGGDKSEQYAVELTYTF
jgi:hypothetical protein